MADSTDMQAKSILLVEDDNFLSDIIQNHLAKAGFTVLIAETGEDAIRDATEKLPSLIILDIVLPGINGLDVMARLREHEGSKGIPFMVLTNSDEDMNLLRSKDLGAVKYMVKALSTPDHIVREVQDFFKGRP